MAAEFPTAVWDGGDDSKDPTARRSPNPVDWAELIEEVQAMQTVLQTFASNVSQDAIDAITSPIGTADGAFEAVGDTSMGDESGAIENNFAEVNAKIDEIIAVLVAAGILVVEV